jgi:FdhD protein
VELIRVGISACLVGQEVRYNGAHKRTDRLIDGLAARFELVPVCPEVEMGLGTPREPMNLYRHGRALRMITVDTRIDHTDGMKAFSARRLEELAKGGISGFVLKKDSPSCGVAGTPTYELDGTGMRRDGSGIFAAAVLERFPHMPVDDEVALLEPGALDQFIDRVVAYSHRSPRRSVQVLRVSPAGAEERGDVAATEEPLEVRLHDSRFAVIMRTPGSDRELAAGFLLAEGIIQSGDELGAIEHCRHPDHPESHNVVNVFLLGRAAGELDTTLAQRRNVLSNSSCGICGRVSIESLATRAEPLASTITVASEVMRMLPDRLRARQPLFEQTGALHAAGIFSATGECVASAEDVGRHNAVDKVVGEMLFAGRLPVRGHVLAVSGRVSYEIVQKAWLAGLEIICAVSAPSSLGIELAQEAGITLIGFARGETFNVYTHAGRIRV